MTYSHEFCFLDVENKITKFREALENIKSILQSIVMNGGEGNVAVVSKGNDIELFGDIDVFRVGVVQCESINVWGV